MRVVIVPGALALLPAYRGLVDPVADLRKVCEEAVAWLLEDGARTVEVLGDERIAGALLQGAEIGAPGDALLVVANGSARRSTTSPGYLDERSLPYDEQVESALARGDLATLRSLDPTLGDDLLCANIAGLVELGARFSTCSSSELRYADDPYGVRYWVVCLTCES